MERRTGARNAATPSSNEGDQGQGRAAQAAGARPRGLTHSRSRDRSADRRVGVEPAGKCSPWWRAGGGGNTPAHGGGERVSRPVCLELKTGTAGRGVSEVARDTERQMGPGAPL